MAKSRRTVIVIVGGVLTVSAIVGLVAYRSLHFAPAFYRVAVEVDPEQQTEASDDCLRQVAALASDVARPGRWQAVFTADQINGFLAVDLARNYPDALPGELENPRIEIRDRLATLACTYRQGEKATVVSISFDVYLSDPNVIALRLRKVRAGLLPVPLAKVLDGISTTARKLDLLLEWRQSHGDPVALVELPPTYDGERRLQLDVIELREGELYLAGETQPGGGNELARLPERAADPQPEPEATPAAEIVPEPSEALEPMEEMSFDDFDAPQPTAVENTAADSAAESATEDEPRQARTESDDSENVQR